MVIVTRLEESDTLDGTIRSMWCAWAHLSHELTCHRKKTDLSIDFSRSERHRVPGKMHDQWTHSFESLLVVRIFAECHCNSTSMNSISLGP